MVYASQGGFWITFAQMGSSALALILTVAFANLLSPETYGLYRYILSIAGVLNIFSLVGMNGAVARAVARGEEGVLRDSVRYQLRWNLLMLAAFGTLAAYYFFTDNQLFAWSFLILGVCVPSTLAFNTYGAYLEGKKEFRLASLFSVGSTLLYTLGMLLVLYLGKGVLPLVATYAGLTLVGTLFSYLLTLKLFRPSGTSSPETLSYGKQLTFIGFLEPISAQVDKIVVAQFWGPAQLAVYTLAMAIPGRAVALIKNLVGLGSPKFATKTKEEINQTFYRRVFQGMLLGGLAAAAYILLAPYLFKYLLPQYLDSILYSQILALALIFAMPNRFVSLLLVAQKMPKTIFVNGLIQTLLRIALYVVLGVWGGVLGLVSAYVIHGFVGMLANIVLWRLVSGPR